MKRSFASRVIIALAATGILGLGACEQPTGPDETREPEVRSIEGVTTDVAAIIGTFSAGPLNRPFLMESMAEFEEFYGGVDPLHEASFHVRAFFQNGGRRIWVSPAGVVSAQGVIDWVNQSGPQLRDRHAALYFGRIEVRENATSGATRWIGASGAAAGVYAWNDRERGVWAAPAGLNVPAIAGVLGTDPLTTVEREALNIARINALTASPVRLWGARTLVTGSTEFMFINVQRLTLHLEALVREKLAWTVGESSGPALWTRARSETEQVLHSLWTSGAFQGLSPNEGYFVRCDITTHTQDDIVAGRLKVLIGFAPLKPAEFVVRTITLKL